MKMLEIENEVVKMMREVIDRKYDSKYDIVVVARKQRVRVVDRNRFWYVVTSNTSYRANDYYCKTEQVKKVELRVHKVQR
jgi:hypothetical protein